MADSRSVVAYARLADERYAERELAPVPASARPAYVLLPERREQTALTLVPEADQWALERRLEEAQRDPAALVAAASGAHARLSPHPVPQPSAWQLGHAQSEEGSTQSVHEKQAFFSNALFQEAQTLAPAALHTAAAPKKPRHGQAAGPLGYYARFAPALRSTPAERFAEFFAGDAFEEEAPFEHDDLSTYAMFRGLLGRAQTHSSVLAGPLGDVPRRAPLPLLQRRYFHPFRMPPRPTDVLCSSGALCKFNTHPVHGYATFAFSPFCSPPAG